MNIAIQDLTLSPQAKWLLSAGLRHSNSRASKDQLFGLRQQASNLIETAINELLQQGYLNEEWQLENGRACKYFIFHAKPLMAKANPTAYMQSKQ